MSNFCAQLGRIFSWSALRRIGSLPLMRAVMFAPVIAYFLLFNDYVINFLKKVSLNIGVPSTSSLELTNIYFIYYGLIIVGISSIIYSIACPESVSKSPDSITFASVVQSLTAKTYIISYFDDVLFKFVENSDRCDETETLDYPESVRLQAARLVVEVYKKYLEAEREDGGDLEVERLDDATPEISSIEEGENNGDWAGFHQDFITGSGYFNAEAIARRAYDAPKVIWAFSEPYRAIAAREFSSDIAFAKYEADNYSRPYTRFSIAIMYALGFILLFIPSVSTFLKITYSIFII
ncbi:hypothetical protein [Breoghania sp. JC706]|uniref:hypothetical protein n=1 Tax=Breoghania sp. JC706 TaxID=3117732 RepID=UPI0030081094